MKAAVWIRVSSERQETANQVPAIEQFAEQRGFEIVKRYELHGSAWDGRPDPGYDREREAMLSDAWKGEFKVLVVWALDRITRGGAEDTLRIIRQLHERGVTLFSVQESWLNTTPEIQDVLVAFAGWMAKQESTRRSERIKAGLARRRSIGHTLGRPQGAKDKRQRKRSGYFAREARERELARVK